MDYKHVEAEMSWASKVERSILRNGNIGEMLSIRILLDRPFDKATNGPCIVMARELAEENKKRNAELNEVVVYFYCLECKPVLEQDPNDKEPPLTPEDIARGHGLAHLVVTWTEGMELEVYTPKSGEQV